jgi:hypothetical protein
MSEIKSTLDLVMERTRHLSLSDDEKRRHQIDTFEKRLQGLLQQYADGALSITNTVERIAALQSEMQIKDRRILPAAVVKRIDPGQDNAHWLDLLARAAPALCEPLQSILDAHRREEVDLLASAGQAQLDRLARENGIAGTAVTPNPRQDAAFQKHLDALRKRTRAGCEGLLDQTAL